jgi:hypothetical protein
LFCGFCNRLEYGARMDVCRRLRFRLRKLLIVAAIDLDQSIRDAGERGGLDSCAIEPLSLGPSEMYQGCPNLRPAQRARVQKTP